MTALRQAREARGWSQAKLIAELERCAKHRKVRLPDRSNLKSQISRWENGRVMPGDLYSAQESQMQISEQLTTSTSANRCNG